MALNNLAKLPTFLVTLTPHILNRVIEITPISQAVNKVPNN